MPLHALGASGVWEVTVPEALPGSLYRFEITNRHTGDKLIKGDPYARGFEHRPGSAAYVVPPSAHAWGDADWLQRRAAWDWQQAPVNIYEVHAGSWMRHPDGTPYLWRELAERLIPYAVRAGLHPPRTAADHRTPARRILGLPDHRLLRADRALRLAGRPARLHRRLPPGRPRRAARLGARPLPAGRLGAGPLRRHRAVRARRPAPGPASPTGARLIFNYGRHEVRNFLLVLGLLVAERVPLRRPARGRGGLDALPRLLAPSRRVAAQPATAAARTSRPSTSCAELKPWCTQRSRAR